MSFLLMQQIWSGMNNISQNCCNMRNTYFELSWTTITWRNTALVLVVLWCQLVACRMRFYWKVYNTYSSNLCFVLAMKNTWKHVGTHIFILAYSLFLYFFVNVFIDSYGHFEQTNIKMRKKPRKNPNKTKNKTKRLWPPYVCAECVCAGDCLFWYYLLWNFMYRCTSLYELIPCYFTLASWTVILDV